MNTESKQSLKKSFAGQGQDKKFVAQMDEVFRAFKNQPSTMLMVSVKTGILRANICRYVAKWKKQGRIVEVKNELCRISKFPARYYSTDKKLFPISKQTKLF
ncbi:hypothetical protein SAMN05444483_11724 [Salegentibacter echinorum]|uniref:Uncharacterized protein n=1 Tax=Salegentibacter echinorum TaxID=1073325 RepID=A0A1M5L0D3_SALEC|nr:hypothetical protein [Salegentibacter echinorum]SHG57883.1 hypothetical protein SAMN05444483_11724 [Salegentibacter echinorum]